MTTLPTVASSAPARPASPPPRRCTSAGIAVRLLRGVRPRRRQLGLRQPQRDVGRLPRRCTSTPRASGWSTRTSRCRKSYPDFPHHTQIAAYFDDYVDHFGFRDRIRFETGVEHAERGADGRLGGHARRDGETARYDALLVANGHHWDPRWPEPALPRQRHFDGEQMHAHDYWTTTQLARQGRRRPRHGQQRDGHRRRGQLRRAHARTSPPAAARWIIPKYLVRQARSTSSRNEPAGAVRGSAQRMLRACSCELQRRQHGATTACPSPTTASARRTRRSPAASSTASPTARSRRSRTSRALDGDEVEFADGTRGPRRRRRLLHRLQDHVPVLRRGLHLRARQRHPALPPRLPPEHRRPLLHRAAAAARRDHAARRGAGQWVADYLRGEYALPRAARDARRHRARAASAMHKRYVASKRHTIQVDFDDYLSTSAKERAPAPSAPARRASACRSRRAPRRRRSARDRLTGARAGKRERTKAANRAAILDAAREVFAEHRLRRGDGARHRARAPTSPPARSTTTSPTRSRCSARCSTRRRARRGARVRAARRAAPHARGVRRATAFRAYFAFLAEDRADVRAHAPQRRHDPRAVRRAGARARASRSCARTSTPAVDAGR